MLNVCFSKKKITKELKKNKFVINSKKINKILRDLTCPYSQHLRKDLDFQM